MPPSKYTTSEVMRRRDKLTCPFDLGTQEGLQCVNVEVAEVEDGDGAGAPSMAGSDEIDGANGPQGN